MTNNIFLKKIRGFSLVEVLLVIAVISVLAGISGTGYFYFKKNNAFNLTVERVANSLRNARLKSQATEGDSAWGVEVQTNKIIIFKGSDFANRDQSFDEASAISGIANISGLSRIVFSKMYGIPQSAGTLILESDSGNKTIEINEKGFIKY